MGSIAASFQFKTYKIDRIQYSMPQTTKALVQNAVNQLELQISLRQPVFDKKDTFYVGGLDIQVMSKTEEKEEHPVFDLKMGIAGIFVVEDRLEELLEENLVKNQIPAILLPYLRAAATTILSCAGIGSIVLPLINIYELAKKAEIQIKEIG